MQEKIMSEEAFEELVNGLDFIGSFTLYGRKSLKYHIKRLQKENQQLKSKLKEVIDYINTTKYSDIVGLNSSSIKDFWFVKEILEILNIDKGEMKDE